MDYAFECTAVPALGEAPLRLIRHGGTAVQASGVESTIDFNCQLFQWDKTYINPLYGQCNPDRDFPAMQDLHACGKLKLDEQITRTYTLEQLPQGLLDLTESKLAKGVILF